MDVITLVLLVTVAVEGRILCPEIGLLGAPTNLTCIPASTSHLYITPIGRTAAACQTSTGKCILTGNISVSVPNTFSSVLTIAALLKKHAGAWKCISDGNVPDPPSCQMTVAKLPTCNITTRQYDDSDFTEDEEVALKVNVTGDYCSESVQFQLQTGNIQTGLKRSQWKATTDVIFNLTESYLGEVKLVFICGGYRQALSCGGIQELSLMNNFDDDTTGGKGLMNNFDDDTTGGKGLMNNFDDDTTGGKGLMNNFDDDTTGGKGLMNNFDDDTTGGKEEHCRSTAVIAGIVGVVVTLINVLAVVICLRRHHCQNRQPPASYLGAVYVPGSAASEYGYATVDDVGYASGQYLRPTVD